jgi:hypothetical protein
MRARLIRALACFLLIHWGHLCQVERHRSMKFTVLILLLIVHPIRSESAIQRCLTYESNSVSLQGRMRTHTFPGRPNYESIAKGDEAERVWLLHLTKPICVVASADWEKEAYVSEVQLVFSEGQNQYDRYRSLLGGRIIATGTLFRAHTGHHHTKVLLTVTEIRNANVTRGSS